MLSPIAVSLLSFAAAAGLLTITPGADTAIVLRSAATGGPRNGLFAALGVCSGLMIWGIGAAVGITALIAASEAAFTALKWLGAAYLVFLGSTLLLRPRTRFEPRANDQDVDASFMAAFGTNVLNPKVGVFYLSLLPQFVPPGVEVMPFTLLLAGIHAALSLVWFGILISLTARLSPVLATPGFITTLDRLTGGLFIAFGARLVLERGA
ncbi:MAG: LysE family translocator [Alphaproteobacteria bacterium]|nr:LysE family translocator [Alphaproteobacteria bacterium]